MRWQLLWCTAAGEIGCLALSLILRTRRRLKMRRSRPFLLSGVGSLTSLLRPLQRSPHCGLHVGLLRNCTRFLRD